MEYQVTWGIEVCADSPEEAAKLAWEIMHDHNSGATFMNVTPEDEEGLFDCEDELTVNMATGKVVNPYTLTPEVSAP